MPWFRIDDKLHDHRKAAIAGAEAMGVWTLCGSWCAEHLETEGFVPERVVARFVRSSRRVASKLVAASLWLPAEFDGEKGWVFLHWAEFQLTPADLAKDRAAARDRMRKLRLERKAGSGEVRTNTPRTFADVLDPTPKPKPLPVVPSELLPEQVPSSAYESNARDEPRGAAVEVSMLQLARAYTDRVKLCDRGKVIAVCTAAGFAGYTQPQIRDGLTVLAGENRTVTVETLRIAIDGQPTRTRNGNTPTPTTTTRVQAGLALVAELEAEES